MNKFTIPLITSTILASLACGLTTIPATIPAPIYETDAAIQSLRNIPTVTPAHTVTITGNVYQRGEGVTVLLVGDVIVAECEGDYCFNDNGRFWRGCVSNNPEQLGCMSR